MINKVTFELVERTRAFAMETDGLIAQLPGNAVTVYNPLDYAWDLHRQYLETFGQEHVEIFLLGMNPGPFGMVQDGVPFGEVNFVKQFLKIDGKVDKPENEHPSRPVLGLSCPRSEISGKRLWTLMQSHYGNKEAMEGKLFVSNYCPLAFISNEKNGRNITPDKLPLEFRKKLEVVCDAYLTDILVLLSPLHVGGIGNYAAKKLKHICKDGQDVITLLHPSPANPLANKDWAGICTAQIKAAGLWN
ncbi:MAG: single-stranded DNA-binding protein [Spirochaetia bacterium]|jgi:single-strand selective monofunctional uracil DNA glycosylase|nr:single-stranded DNA-binding protein [Spirochaetia bacterium]